MGRQNCLCLCNISHNSARVVVLSRGSSCERRKAAAPISPESASIRSRLLRNWASNTPTRMDFWGLLGSPAQTARRRVLLLVSLAVCCSSLLELSSNSRTPSRSRSSIGSGGTVGGRPACKEVEKIRGLRGKWKNVCSLKMD